LKWILIVLAVGLLAHISTLSARGRLSEKYRQSGDNLLLQKKFLSADLEYRKALMLNGNNTKAKENRILTEKAADDILTLGNFVKDNSPKESALFDLATGVPKSETEAVLTSKKLIEEGEYQLAAFPAKTATEMDRTYSEAWIYLGISYLKSAQLLETSNEQKATYKNQAKAAFEQAKEVDPENQLAIKLLNTM
jgi:Flp pilus assembly protein TadD